MERRINTPEWWHNPERDKLDRRSRKTREALYTALAALLQDRPLNSISVTELTRAADVNRSTFYVHFQDIFDMFESMQRDFKITLSNLVASYAEQLRGGEYAMLLRMVYEYFRTNREVFTLIFDEGRADSLFDSTFEILRDRLTEVFEDCLPELEEQGAAPADRDAALPRRVRHRGTVGMARVWLERGCKESVEEMAELNEQLDPGDQGDGHRVRLGPRAGSAV